MSKSFDYITEIIMYGYETASKLYMNEHPNTEIPHLVFKKNELSILATSISDCNLDFPDDVHAVSDANPVESINEISDKYPNMNSSDILKIVLSRAAVTHIFYRAIFYSIGQGYHWITLSEITSALYILSKFHVSKEEINTIRNKITIALKMQTLHEDESRTKK